MTAFGLRHQKRVARVEPVGDAPAGLVGHDVLRPDRPLARVFGKLGIRSRWELARALPASDSEVVPT